MFSASVCDTRCGLDSSAVIGFASAKRAELTPGRRHKASARRTDLYRGKLNAICAFNFIPNLPSYTPIQTFSILPLLEIAIAAIRFGSADEPVRNKYRWIEVPDHWKQQAVGV